jgi:2-dehydro-3-deoxyphosphogluconate aldolase/(4S)-4-hydroxy-2-oxoglutarate aldolase
MKIDEILAATPVLPVLVIHDAAKAVPLARALVAGGIRVLEVTLRTPAALKAVSAIAREVPEAIVGVGTLVRPEQFVQAQDAGARFAVSPGLTRVLLNASGQSNLPYLPGVFTPSEVMAARDVGFEHLKLFPAAQAGGIGMLKALGGLFPELRFCPTGGIHGESFRAYLALPNVACVGGSWVAPTDLIEQQDWGAITALARAATAAC